MLLDVWLGATTAFCATFEVAAILLERFLGSGVAAAGGAAGCIFITVSTNSAICSGVYFARSGPICSDNGLTTDMLCVIGDIWLSVEIVLCNKDMCENGNWGMWRKCFDFECAAKFPRHLLPAPQIEVVGRRLTSVSCCGCLGGLLQWPHQNKALSPNNIKLGSC